MLDDVQRIKRHLPSVDSEIDLQTIMNVVMACTPIDRLLFTRYESSPNNPIWGKFERWDASLAYLNERVVKIFYASHLDEPWYRYVVCKELCHALDSDQGHYSITRNSIDELIARFALRSAREKPNSFTPDYSAELVAELCAIEILCPYHIRQEMIAHGDRETFSGEQLALRFNIPVRVTEFAFSDAYMDTFGAEFGGDLSKVP